MATILSLKRRIKAAQNVSKTTKAMQMIAASKLKRAQEAALSARPYVEKLSELTYTLNSKHTTKVTHPYLTAHHTTGKTLLIVLSPDKGLCGGLITNLLKEFFRYSHQEEASLVVLGKKLETKITQLKKEVIATFSFGTTTPTFDMVFPVAQIINDYYLSKKVDSVKVLYAHYNSIFTQTPKVATLLPIPLKTEVIEEKDYLFEPGVDVLLPDLLTHYFEMSLYQFLLESFVSEQGSRMIAMQNATTNANDIIEALKLEYNKTRQAKITSELLDLIGGKVA